MIYDNESFRELEELSHSDNPEIKEKAGNWLIAIGLQDVDGLRVSPYLLDLTVRNSNGELSSEDVERMLNEHYAGQQQLHLLNEHSQHEPSATTHSHPLDGNYEIIPEDDPRVQKIEEYNRKLRPDFYARLDAERVKQAGKQS